MSTRTIRPGFLPLATGALVVCFVLACKGPELARVGEARLAQADDYSEAEDAPTVEIVRERAAELPVGPVVRLAIDRDVPFGRVDSLLAQMRERGTRPVFLVGQHHKIKAFTFPEETAAPGEAIQATATMDGKICVSPPGVPEAKCSQSYNRKYIDKAGVRELVREAVKAYGLTRVELLVPRQLSWADLVRSVDGARTCCPRLELDEPVTVRLLPLRS